MKGCHTCPFNGKHSDECLSCMLEEQYNYSHAQYILDTYTPPQPDTSGSEQVTSLPDDAEDIFRKALYVIFTELTPFELLTLQGIMQQKTLQDIADSLEKFFKKNDKKQTRFHAFQARKAMLRKLGEHFSGALLTAGQRKVLK